MSSEPAPGLRPDLFGQLAATDPVQGRQRRLFERGQVAAVHGNEADVLVGHDARSNPLELKQVPIASGYAPRIGDWVAVSYEGGNSGAPWVTGPSMAADASADPSGIGVFAVTSEEPSDPQQSTIYFDATQQAWRGWDGEQWVDLIGGAHNDMGYLQGGAPGEYYHLTAAEYSGVWGHMLQATSNGGIPLIGIRSTAQTDSYASALWAKHLTSGDMSDGFAVGILFSIEDNAGVSNAIGRFYAVRAAGADNTGDFVWEPATAGVFNERMRLSNAGVLTVPGRVNVGAGGYAAVAGRIGADHIGLGVAADSDYRIATDGIYHWKMSRAGSTDTWGWILTTSWGGVLALRNLTDDAAANVLAFSEDFPQIGAADGTEARPSFAFFDDWDTGTYRCGANAIGWSTGGTHRMLLSGYDLTIGGYAVAADLGIWLLTAGSSQDSFIYHRELSANYGYTVGYDGGLNAYTFRRHENSAVGSIILTLYRDRDVVNLTPGTNLPTANGDLSMYATGQNVQVCMGGAAGVLQRTLYQQTALAAGDTQTGGTFAEVVFASGTYAIPAALWAVGKTLRIYAKGYCYHPPGTSSGSIALRLKIGSTVLATVTWNIAYQDPAQWTTWELEARVSCRSTGAGGAMDIAGEAKMAAPTTTNLETGFAYLSVDTGNGGKHTLTGRDAALALNTTVGQTITCTAEHSTAGGVAYSRMRAFTIEELA